MGTKGIINTPSNFPVPKGSASPTSKSTDKNPPYAKKTTDQPREQVVVDNRHKK